MAPRDFYDLSLCEWFAMLDGYMESQGIQPGSAPATKSDLEQLERELK